MVINATTSLYRRPLGWSGTAGSAILAALFIAGCQSPASISVEPARPMITKRAGSVRLKATVKDASGKVLPKAEVSFRSLSPTVINVSADGVVTAIRSGQGKVLVRSGKVSVDVPVIVQIPKRIEIDPDSPMLMLGVTRAFKATVYTDRGEPMIAGEARWETSDPSVITVDDKGNVKTLKEGEATLTVHAAGISGSTKVIVKHEVLNEDGTLTQ